MVQLEPYQKVYIEAESTYAEVDPFHAEIGCVTCHGGMEPVVSESEARLDLWLAMMEAHEAVIHYEEDGEPDRDQVGDHNLVRDPSTAADLNCNGSSCHGSIVERNQNSMHSQLWGEKHKVALRAGYESWEQCPQSLRDSFNGECMSCHTTCGQCHVSRPNSVHGGFLNSHLFQRRPEIDNNCTACHGSRVGNDFTGHLEGNEPDIHFEQGYDCFFCHQEDLHGDGRTDYTTRYEVEGLPRCVDCHALSADDNLYHERHWPGGENSTSDLACYVCHSQPYTNCINCHTEGVWKSEDPQGYAEFPGFRIGHNSGNWPGHDPEEEEWVVVRHIPISQDSFSPWGWESLANWNAFETWELASPHNIRRITPQTAVALEGEVNDGNCGNNCHSVSWAPDLEANQQLYLWSAYVDSLGQHITGVDQTETEANANVVVDDHLPAYWTIPE